MSESESRDQILLNLGKELINRGMGLYGRDKIAELAYKSGIALLDDNTVEWLDSEEKSHEDTIKNFLVEYSKINLPAKMTVIVYARKFKIDLPDSIRKRKRRRSRLRKWFSR
ncbi:MAG: hypothetical protein ACTSPV_18520 [Candidatus Hodarchaeales archaeon]